MPQCRNVDADLTADLKVGGYSLGGAVATPARHPPSAPRPRSPVEAPRLSTSTFRSTRRRPSSRARRSRRLPPPMRHLAFLPAAACVLAVLTSARPAAAQPADSRAAQLFADRCAPCHGGDGRGAERGPDIVTTPAAGRRSAAEIARVIREGIPGGGMPPMALATGDIDIVAAHVRALADQARTPPSWPRVRAVLGDGTRRRGTGPRRGRRRPARAARRRGAGHGGAHEGAIGRDDRARRRCRR